MDDHAVRVRVRVAEAGSGVGRMSMADISIAAPAGIPSVREQSRARGVFIAFSALFAICLVPLALVELPPLNDYPNHLARAYIQIYGSASPLLKEFYRPAWAFQPNLAMDLVVGALGRLLNIELAGKVFLGLVFLSISSGAWVLHWALHRKFSYWPLAAFLLLFNRIFLGGMVSFLFTLGLAMWALAGWVALADRPAIMRGAFALPTAFVLYLCHFEGFGIYALILTAYEASRSRGLPWKEKLGRLGVAAAQFVPPLAVFAALSRTANQTGAISLSSVMGKLTAPLNLFYNYHPVLDGVSFLLVAGVVLYGLIRRDLAFAKFTVLPLAALAAIYLALPDAMLGSHGVDRRIPLAFALLLIASTEWVARPSFRDAGVAAALTVLFAVRMAAIAEAWRSANPLYAQYFAAFGALPEGARLAVATAHKWSETTVHPPVHSIAAMAAIRRSAFVPIIYADPREEALAFTPEYKRLADLQAARVYFPEFLERMKIPAERDAVNPFRADRLAPFDYLLEVNPTDFPVPGPERATTLFEGQNFVLYRLGH
ncbi:MAG TPA: hypothetical protein VH639_25480 [Bryobacteraceae bacterium]|jgi:hypothetical protein